MKKAAKKLCAAVTALSLALSLGIMGSSAASASAQKFKDVAPGDACYEDVTSANKYGLMAGVSDTEFDTTSVVNRAMWTTMLRKMAGNPEVDGRDAFTDVKAGSWYAPAATWASDNGLAAGYPDGSFGVTNDVTRQELVVMAAKFVEKFKGTDTAVEADLSSYADAADVSSWALDAVKWAVGTGILLPVDGKIAPKSTISRADVAGVAVRLYELGGVDADTITALDIDWTQAAQLPLTGWFVKNFEGGRTATVYISEEASTRTYITVVAVPNGVDTQKFLADEGWVDLMDKKGEALFVLEPGADGWGTPAEEAAYVDAAIGFLKSGVNAKGVGVFSTFGEFYLAGYGEGAPILEAWSAANPIFVISQAFMDGKGVGQADLAELGAAAYDGTNTSGYDAGVTDAAKFQASLEATGMKKITRADVPVPTWFDGYDAKDSSITYWKTANDTVSNTTAKGVYNQAIDSDAVQTLYANQVAKASGARYGISQVKVSSEDPNAAAVYAFLSVYTRYDNSFAYSNALAYRLDYTAARVGAQQQAKAGKVLKTVTSPNGPVEILGKSDVKVANHGTVQFGVFTFSDNSGDGVNDPREYMVYIPDGFQGAKLPVLYVYPGNTQSDEIFFDCTAWYQVADKEGIALVFVCETYDRATALTHKDADKYQVAMDAVLASEIDGSYGTLDFTRVYGTGQSLGSMTTQGFARTNPEFFAAVASTSGLCGTAEGDAMPEGVGEAIPAFLISGQSDLPNLLPDLWSSDTIIDWAQYLFEVNGLTDATIGTAADPHEFVSGRTNVYTWKNADGIPLVQWGQTLLRPHNCYPSEMPLMWDFLEHFSKDADGNRFYSASAFAEDDAVAIP